MPNIWDKVEQDPHVARKMVSEAIQHLRQARNLLKSAGAKRSLERVRATLKSAEGAERHAVCKAVRHDVAIA